MTHSKRKIISINYVQWKCPSNVGRSTATAAANELRFNFIKEIQFPIVHNHSILKTFNEYNDANNGHYSIPKWIFTAALMLLLLSECNAIFFFRSFSFVYLICNTLPTQMSITFADGIHSVHNDKHLVKQEQGERENCAVWIASICRLLKTSWWLCDYHFSSLNISRWIQEKHCHNNCLQSTSQFMIDH